MAFDIVPLHGITGLAFGASKDDVRLHFGEGYREFRRTPGAALSDYWADLALFAYYDEAARLEALEFAPEAVVRLAGQNLFALDGRAATKFLSDMDGTLTEDADGLTSERLGIGIWTNARPIDSAPQSVLVFRHGYLDLDRI